MCPVGPCAGLVHVAVVLQVRGREVFLSGHLGPSAVGTSSHSWWTAPLQWSWLESGNRGAYQVEDPGGRRSCGYRGVWIKYELYSLPTRLSQGSDNKRCIILWEMQGMGISVSGVQEGGGFVVVGGIWLTGCYRCIKVTMEDAWGRPQYGLSQCIEWKRRNSSHIPEGNMHKT